MSFKHAAQPSSSSRRKSVSKRPLIQSDDDAGAVVAAIQRTKRPRTADTDASLSVATTSDGDNDMDIDIKTLRDSVPRSLSATDDGRFLPDDHPGQDPTLRADTSKKRKKLSVVKRKPQVLHSDDEVDNSHVEPDSVDDPLSDPPSPLSEMSDDFDLDTPPKRSASKAKASTAKPKAKPGQLKGAKTKAPKERERDREIFMKDERRLAVPLATTSRASSAAAQSQPSDLLSNEDPAPPSVVDPMPDASQATKDPLSQAIPKKRKLPTIKKTKAATSTTGTSTPTVTTQKPAPPVQELPKPSLPASEQRKQALTGVRDVDLADSKIYAELFKGVGGNTPKSGLKNAEERRKELDKMRDEARARRAEETKFTFDLQAQADKIARFEQRLRAENSTVLHPNFLAAKFRDEWEMERRARRATPKEEGEA